MTNQISSPYADFIQEQKKQKYLKKIDVSMIASYHIAYYETIIKLRKSTINTLSKNKGKILNKNILEKINEDIKKVLPYEDFGLMAYHQKPTDKTEENRIYFYCHHQDNFFNIEISKPPNLKIWGFFTKLIIVDSTPTLDLPPSRINLIFFPNVAL